MARDTSKLVTIPGELHSAATGNIVSASQEIFDYDSNSYQSQLNKQTYNVSAHGDTSLTYTLDEAIAAVPDTYHVGGLIITFVNENGEFNMYQLGKKTWSSDVNDWSCIYATTENPEFVDVHLDSSNHVLYGVRKDGDFYFGGGIPSQVKSELDVLKNEIDVDIKTSIENFENRVDSSFNEVDIRINNVDSSLNEFKEDASVKFANIDSSLHDLGFYEDNPEFIKVSLDSSNKILYGVQKDGNFYFGAGVPNQIKSELDLINSKIDNDIENALERVDASINELRDEIDSSISERLDRVDSSLHDLGFYEDNQEFVKVSLDSSSKVLYGVQKDGNFYFGGGVPSQVKSYVDEKDAKIDASVFDIETRFYNVNEHDGSVGINYTLEEAIAAVPEEYRRGGLILTFNSNEFGGSSEQNSENKYVQYRYMSSDAATAATFTNTGNWSFCGDDVLVENPEFVRVITDKDGRILLAIEPNGNIKFGAGVPQQIIDYIQQKISELSLDEYEDIVTFLGNLIEGDTLATLLNAKANAADVNAALDTKVDKVAGKSLIDTEYANGISYVENPEFAAVCLDHDNKVLFGVKTDGDFYFGYGVPSQIAEKQVEIQAEIQANTVAIETKVNKVAGKGLIQNEVSESLSAIEDPEGRSEITTDSEDKILSYRDSEGVMHEEVGIKTENVIANTSTFEHLNLIAEGLIELEDKFKEDGFGANVNKKYYLPEFGRVNIKSETFYLTADPHWSTKDDVVCIQMYDDTNENAQARKTLSYYYIKSTLTPLAGGGYDRTSVNENSVRLDLFAGKEIGQTFGIGTNNKTYFTDEVTKVNGVYYVTSSLVDGEVVPESIVVTEFQTKTYYVKKLKQVGGVWYLNSTLEGGAIQQVDYKGETVNGKAMISVLPITDVPPYKAWCVNKNPEHYCIADIDFETFYSKNNVPISIKYQGSGTTALRKRGLRLTFYKKNDYKKKDKIKIGEFVRLSGYNMKSYATDPTRIKDPILSNIFIEMWENRGKECYPWNVDSIIYNGATGMIKSFPIETWVGEEFYGLQFFSEKKDEKNYCLDGDDDASGIFVNGIPNGPHVWENASHVDWTDELEAVEPMSQETADALDELFKYTKGFVNGTIEIDGEQVKCTREMLEEHIDAASWIDYWIGLELFTMTDSTYRNIILHTRADKKKFYMFFYDTDNSLNLPYDCNFIEAVTDPEHPASGTILDMSFWSKFTEEYKDSIINRYVELRKSVLSIANIKAIYKKYVSGIPNNVIIAEDRRWGTDATPYMFEEKIDYLNKRMNYLDSKYFDL